MTGSPLRPDEREPYGTPVATKELEEPEAAPSPAGQLGGSPPWIVLAVVLIVLFVVLLGAWALFLPR